MNIIKLLSEAQDELKSKGKIIDGFVNETSNFQDISLFFERIKEYSNLLSDDLRKTLYSSYIDWVNKEQGKGQTVYSDGGDINEIGLNTNDFISIGKKYELVKSNVYSNKRTNNLSKAVIAATIVVATVMTTMAGPKISAHYVNEPVKNTPTTTIVQTTNEQSEISKNFSQTTNNQKEYFEIKYETKFGDNSENEIGTRLGISGNEIEITSEYNKKAGENIILRIEDKGDNKEKAEKYDYNNKIVKYKVFSYVVEEGEVNSLNDIANYAIDTYWVFGNCGKNPNEISSEIGKDNPDLYKKGVIYPGTFEIYYHDTQANIDQLLEESKLPKDNNFVA